MNGLKLLESIKRLNPAMPVVMMTAFGSIPDAVEAMRLGAYDYVTKPFTADHIVHVVARALEMQELRAENKELRDRIETLTEPEPFLTYSPHSRKLAEIGGAGGRQRRDRADHRRKRHRQEHAGVVHPSPESAQRRAVRASRMHDAQRASAGERTVRARARIVHRRDQGQAGTPRSGGGRHGSARRDWRPDAGGSIEAAAFSAGADVRARRRCADDQSRCAHHSRDQSASRAVGQGEALPRGPLLPPQRDRIAGARAARSAGRNPEAGGTLRRAGGADAS